MEVEVPEVVTVTFNVIEPVSVGITGPGACVIPGGIITVSVPGMIEGIVSKFPVSSVDL